MHIKHFYHSEWLVCIEKVLNDCGYSEFWLSQSVPQNMNLSLLVKQRLRDQFKQSWYNNLFNSPKCLNYRIFKCTHNFEKYLLDLPYDLRKAYCNFRCLNHRLPIEQGRFWGVERDDRICDICDMQCIGDEFHYLFECKFFSMERNELLPKDSFKYLNTLKFNDLFNCNDFKTKVNVVKLCKIILSVVNCRTSFNL